MKWDLKKVMAPKDCTHCSAPLPLVRHYKTYLCADCKRNVGPKHFKYGHAAHQMVACAVRYGYLLPARECACVDCGAPAVGYDHRDYNKPLDVEPVCAGCNVRRGPAKAYDANRFQAAA